MKKRADQIGAKGNCATASGYAIKASPGPEIQEYSFYFDLQSKIAEDMRIPAMCISKRYKSTRKLTLVILYSNRWCIMFLKTIANTQLSATVQY